MRLGRHEDKPEQEGARNERAGSHENRITSQHKLQEWASAKQPQIFTGCTLSKRTYQGREEGEGKEAVEIEGSVEKVEVPGLYEGGHKPLLS